MTALLLVVCFAVVGLYLIFFGATGFRNQDRVPFTIMGLLALAAAALALLLFDSAGLL